MLLGYTQQAGCKHIKRSSLSRKVISGEEGLMYDLYKQSFYNAIFNGEKWIIKFMLLTRERDRGFRINMVE